MIDIVFAPTRQWSDAQVQKVATEVARVEDSVPYAEGMFQSFILLKGDEPVGTAGFQELREGVVEFAFRYWGPNRLGGFVAARCLKILFHYYEYIIARCYTNNHDIKRLLQRAGFVLLQITKQDGRQIEFYGARQRDFERVTENMRWLTNSDYNLLDVKGA